MFNFASRCLSSLLWQAVLWGSMLVQPALIISIAYCDSTSDATESHSMRLRSVEIFPAGQGVFQYSSNGVSDGSVGLKLEQRQLDDVLKTLVVRGLDQVRVDYSLQSEHRDVASMVLNSNASTRAEILKDFIGQKVKVTGPKNLDGFLAALELQTDRESKLDIEVMTIHTERGLEQCPLLMTTSVQFADVAIQASIDAALRRRSGPSDDSVLCTIEYKNEKPGKAAFSYQTDVAPWKCSYRIAKIGGKVQLVASAVVDNTSRMDWEDIDLHLIVDQPLGFHTPISQVLSIQRPSRDMPISFTTAPPTIAAGYKDSWSIRKSIGTQADTNSGDPFAEPNSPAAMGLGGGGMGGMGGGGMGGLAGPRRSSSTANVANELSLVANAPQESVEFQEYGLSFAASDMASTAIGRRVQVDIPHVSISSNGSSSVFLPPIPQRIDELRMYVPNVHSRHPLAAFEVTLLEGYQLPGGPGSVWTEHGYAGDIMIPKLVSQIPQIVTYSIDSNLDITTEMTDSKMKSSEWKWVSEKELMRTVSCERERRYRVENNGTSDQTVIVEFHRETGWTPDETELKTWQANKDHFRYRIPVAANQSNVKSIRETNENFVRWNSSTPIEKLEKLLTEKDLPSDAPARVQVWIDHLKKIRNIKDRLDRVNGEINAYQREQTRISGLLKSLHRDDEVYGRYAKKLGTLEDSIEQDELELKATLKELEAAE